MPVTPVSAIPPNTAPVSTSVTLVVPVPLLISVVRVIVLETWSSMLPSEGVVAAGVSTGASFTSVTVSEAVLVAVLKGVTPPVESVCDKSLRPVLAPPVASQAW